MHCQLQLCQEQAVLPKVTSGRHSCRQISKFGKPKRMHITQGECKTSTECKQKGPKRHPTASQCCLHQTIERELRASQRHPKPKLYTTALAGAVRAVQKQHPKGTRFPICQQEDPCTQGPGYTQIQGVQRDTSSDTFPRTLE